MSALKRITKKLLSTLYWWTCLGLWLGYFGLMFYVNFVHRELLAPTEHWFHHLPDLWPLTDSPLANVTLALAGGAIALALIPGFICVGLYLLIVLPLTIGLLGGSYLVFTLIAQASRPGAITFAVAMAVFVVAAVWKDRTRISQWLRLDAFFGIFFELAPILRPLRNALFGIFIDWWLYPLWFGYKKRRLRAEMASNKEAMERAYDELQTEFPQLASVSYTNFVDLWWQRFRTGELQKTYEKQTALVNAAQKFFDAYMGAASAYDEVSRRKEIFKAKWDERKVEAEEREVRSRRLQKEKLELERDIKAIRTPPPPPTPAPPRDPLTEERNRREAKIREEKRYQEAMEEEIHLHPDHEKQIRWTYRKRIEELWSKP